MRIDKLTIGVLLPNSSILPMAKHFNAGLKHGLKKLNEGSGVEVEIIPEFIGQGSAESAHAAVQKLVSFDDADLITGIISNKIAFGLSERMSNAKLPVIINNIGEHLPDLGKFNDYLFTNSSHTWQQLWSLGKWGVEHLGKKGMFVSSLYDCGYSFQTMFGAGMIAGASDSVMPFAIAPAPDLKALADVSAVFQYIHNTNPDFVMAAFCGDEAKLFLQQYVEEGFHKTTPLLGLPFLLESFQTDEELTVYTTISSSEQPSAEDIDQLGRTAMNPFTDFGFETGTLIADAVNISGGLSLHEALKMVSVDAKRGNIRLSPNVNSSGNKVFVLKNSYKGDKNSVDRSLVAQVETIDIHHQSVAEFNAMPSSGWMNPYLGI